MGQTAFIRPDIIRPPSEWRSYFLPLTAGSVGFFDIKGGLKQSFPTFTRILTQTRS